MAANNSSAEPWQNETEQADGFKYQRDEDLARIEIAILAVIFSATVVGNVLVLVALFNTKKKMTRMYYFMMHLSIADLFTAFFNVLTQLIWEITYRFVGGNLLCKVVKYMQIFGPYLSSYILTVTALDRYRAICFPLQNCKWTDRRYKAMIAAAWFVTLCLCTPQVFIFSFMKIGSPPGGDVYDCWATFIEPWGAKTYVTWYSFTIFIIPLIVLIYTYFNICRTIWRSKNWISTKGSPVKRCVKVSRLCEDQPQRQKGNGFYREHRQLWKRLSLSSNSQSMTNSNVSAETIKLTLDEIDERETENEISEIMDMALKSTAEAVEISPPVSCSFFQSCSSTSSARPVVYTTSNSSCETTSVHSSLRHATEPSTRDSSLKSSSRAKLEKGTRIFNRSDHLHRNISRAKVRTVQLTVVVISCYVFCSTPFIAAQLWATWDPHAMKSPFWSGATFTILTLLASLNSCANPIICLAFNTKLLTDLFQKMPRKEVTQRTRSI